MEFASNDTVNPKDASVWIGSFGINAETYPVLQNYSKNCVSSLKLLSKSWYDPCASIEALGKAGKIEFVSEEDGEEITSVNSSRKL